MKKAILDAWTFVADASHDLPRLPTLRAATLLVALGLGIGLFVGDEHGLLVAVGAATVFVVLTIGMLAAVVGARRYPTWLRPMGACLTLAGTLGIWATVFVAYHHNPSARAAAAAAVVLATIGILATAVGARRDPT